MTLKSDKKWHEELGKFSLEILKVWKLGVLWGRFVQSRKCMSLKFRQELCHDNKEWCKIWRGIHLPFQNWHWEFEKFLPEHLII